MEAEAKQGIIRSDNMAVTGYFGKDSLSTILEAESELQGF